MSARGFLILIAYFGVFLAALVGVVWWDRRKRRTRKPFPEDLKLLRMPGEYLWRRVMENDESDMQWWFIIMLAPMIAGTLMLWIVAQYLHSFQVAGLVATVVVFAFSMLLCIRWLLARLSCG